MSKTLLVIDDSATVRQIVRWVFHGMDTEVSEAANAQAARDAVQAAAPDVILVDYHLPDGSGLALCRELREQPALSNTRIVLLTGEFHPLDEAEAASCGADATLKKPFKSQPLIDIIEGGTEHQASAPAPSPTQPPAAAAPATREPGDSNLSFDVEEEEGAPPPPPSGASGARPSPTVPGSGLRNVPPAPGSGARKLPPVPGSGLRNLPPVPGSGNYRSVSGATRLPRSGSPTGSHSPVRDAEETVSTQAAAAPSPNEATTQAAPAVPTPAAAAPAATTPAASKEQSTSTPAPTPTQSGSGASPPPGARPGARSAEQITTEISAVSEDEASAEESAAGGVSDAQLRRVLQEMLPPLIRRAVVEELQSGLNDKVISHGRRSVDEWVENKLPLLAEQVIGRKLDE